MYKTILTKEYLETATQLQKSSLDIAREIGGNARTVRWYLKKWNVKGLKTKPHQVWNKGLKAVDDTRIARSINKAHKARKGKPSWNKGEKLPPLSQEHRLKVSLSLSGKYVGELSSNWKGGVSPINKILRRSAKFKRWRKAVFERDDYTCQICKVRGGELHPDHIKQFAYYPELRFELSNGRTLCKPCHMKTPTWGNNKRAALATW